MFKEIKALVAEGKLSEAIESLRELSRDPQYADELIGYMARYNDLSKHIRSNLLSYEEISINKNKLTRSLLALLAEMEGRKGFQPTHPRGVIKQWKRYYGWGVIPIAIILLITSWFVFNQKMNDNEGVTETKIENRIENSTNSGIIQGVSSQQGVTINFELKDTLNEYPNQDSSNH